MQNHSCSCAGVLQRLREIDFCLTETVLYLDAYPDHAQALDYYHHLLEERCALMEQYESSCGPLTANGNVSHTTWDWAKTPWPREADAN